MPDKLPEEFAPTGPKLSKFPIRPAPPIKPRLFADEARFALRLSVVAGASECAIWIWFSALATFGRNPLNAFAAVLLMMLRVVRPGVAVLGVESGRLATAAGLLGIAVVEPYTLGLKYLFVIGFAALGDLVSSCMTDSITVERRQTALSWLDMAQGLGIALGLAIGQAPPPWSQRAATAVLLLAFIGARDLRDRGTPRSTYTPADYKAALRAPAGRWLTPFAFAIGAVAFSAARRADATGWKVAIAIFVGMACSAVLQPRLRNAVELMLILVVLAGISRALPAVSLLGWAVLGAAASGLPACVARAAAEMERAPTSSLVWTALTLGAAIGAVV